MPSLIRLKPSGLSPLGSAHENLQTLAHRSAAARITWDGIETCKRCLFRHWIPGEEYTEVLTFKNLSGKNVSFTYEVPKTQYFQTIYPRRLTLSQGVTFTLPIQFSPIENVPYADELVVCINQAPYRIMLAGLLPQSRLKFEPTEVNFGYCAVQDTQLRSFKVTNTGDLETNLEWNASEPFSIEPRECVLPVGGTQTFSCSFHPQWALIYMGTATCTYGSSVGELHLHGVGKFPHVVVRSSDGSIDEHTGNVLVDFGSMPMTGVLKRELVLTNQSAFRVPFRIESLPGVAKYDTAFRFGKTEGVLDAGKKQTIAVRFQPQTSQQAYREYFNVSTQQGHLVSAIVECSGKSMGNSIEINHQRITFGQVAANSRTTRIIELHNPQEASSARFQIYSSPDSPFHFSTEHGTILGNRSKLTVIITFTPTYPMGYYKIVPVLIEHQSPILLELIGTCHSDNGKPPVLNDRYITNFKRHVSRHLALYPFEMFSDYLKRGKLTIDEFGSLVEVDDEALSHDERTIKEYLQVPLANPSDDNYAYWFSTEDNARFEYVTLSERNFIFDQCSLDTTTEWQQSLTVTNLTRGKVVFVWLTTDTSDSSIFSITPTQADILPLKSTAFRVVFRPKIVDTFYDKHFEGYAFYKNQRDFTLVPDYGVMLPVQYDLTCTGHTLRANHEIPPTCRVDRDILIFPPLDHRSSIYQTLTLTNEGTTPLIYRFLSKTAESTSAFTFKPSHGSIKPGDYTLVLVRYRPVGSQRGTDIHQERIILRLNEREKFDQHIHAFATQDKARLLIPNEGQLHALTTCVGLTSETHFQMKSLTRTQLEYQWTLDKNLPSVRIEPAVGSFAPYEEKDFTIIYQPKQEEKLIVSTRLTCWIGDRSKSTSEIHHLTVHASTRDGFLRASEPHHDVGPVALGASISYDLYLTNGSDCLLRYRLYAKQSKVAHSTDDEPLIIDFLTHQADGHDQIDGKAKIRVPCRIHPFSRSTYQLDITYDLLNDQNERLSEQAHHLCTLIVHGVYPHITFTDILGSEQAASLSKNLLFKAFNLNKINALLAKEPTANELTYAIHHYDREDPSERKRLNNSDPALDDQPQAISFNFNAAPIRSPPSNVHVLLENSSDLDTTWSFLLPKDLKSELEYWARTGDFTEDELNDMKLQDNKIFTIQPKKGVLSKGATVTVTLSYKHIFPGQHTLPAIFKVGRSRQIMLNLVGTSVEIGQPYVQFYSTVHHLLPVELGAQGAPVQQYELWNGGTVPVRFQVDMNQLEQISLANYGFWVLDCLTPEGVIAPSKSFVTQWVFNPLEAREYVFNLKIDLDTLEPAIITFTGRGFDKRFVSVDISNLLTENLHKTKQLNLNDRLASLTIDRIHFGNLPLFTRQRRITFLRNPSNRDALSFIWHVTNPEQVRCIRIQPVRGVIQPRQSLPIKVTFMAIEAPAFHDIDLVCEIYNETKREQYTTSLKRWESDIQGKWERFEINDSEYQTYLLNGSLEERDVEQQDHLSQQGSSVQLCRTLPPVIIKHELEESNLDRKRRLRAHAKKQTTSKPQLPAPELLHLALTARTLVYNEYLDLCPDTRQLGKFFIDTCLGGEYRDESLGKQTPDDNLLENDRAFVSPDHDLIVSIDEADLLGSTLSDLLRSLLSDRVFVDTLPEMIAENIPYFSQLKFTQPSARSTEQKHDVHSAPSNETNVSEHERGTISSSAEQGGSMPIPHERLLPNSSSPSTLYDFDAKASAEENERLKNNPNMTSLMEDVLENTLWNILQEAYHGEFSLTARPRLIALPPKRQTLLLTHANLQQSDSKQPLLPPLIMTESFE